jgi:hypothetical protein
MGDVMGIDDRYRIVEDLRTVVCRACGCAVAESDTALHDRYHRAISRLTNYRKDES